MIKSQWAGLQCVFSSQSTDKKGQGCGVQNCGTVILNLTTMLWINRKWQFSWNLYFMSSKYVENDFSKSLNDKRHQQPDNRVCYINIGIFFSQNVGHPFSGLHTDNGQQRWQKIRKIFQMTVIPSQMVPNETGACLTWQTQSRQCICFLLNHFYWASTCSIIRLQARLRVQSTHNKIVGETARSRSTRGRCSPVHPRRVNGVRAPITCRLLNVVDDHSGWGS